MAEYELYCFAQSGNAYKAALMLELCGADWTPRYVDFFGGEARGEAYRALNEMGEVPVLVHRAERLSQTGVILDYLVEQFGRFGPETAAERREIWRWILFDNHKLTSYTATLRYLRTLAKTGETPVTEFLHKRVEAAYGVLDRHLAGQAFVVADRPSIADISLCGYLFFEGEIGVEPRSFANISAWLDRIRGLEGWRHPYDLMPGHPLPAA